LTLLFSIPPTIEVGSGEQKPFAYDMSNAIAQGDIVSQPSATVYDENQQAFVPSAIVGQPSVAGNLVTVWFDGTPLQESTNRYRVVVTFTANSKILQRASWISVPF
jgi:hypothetical protein